jgi:hypothetical protein
MTRLIIQGVFLVVTVMIMDVQGTPLSLMNLNLREGGGKENRSKIVACTLSMYRCINF